VLNVAVPENGAVHWKTCSGAPSVMLHVPASVLGPVVVPLNIPPCGGTRVTFAHASGVAVTVGVGVVVTVGVAVSVGVAVAVGV
jgi:hypothetical protein